LLTWLRDNGEGLGKVEGMSSTIWRRRKRRRREEGVHRVYSYAPHIHFTHNQACIAFCKFIPRMLVQSVSPEEKRKREEKK